MKTILVVEDNDAIREDIAEILSLAGYQVLTAQNGKVGIEIAQKSLPDLIISDIMMPVVDGLGMLHVLRHDPKTETIPLIFLTAKNERHVFRNAMESGADDYISKPFNNDELLKAIENRFKRMEVVRKLRSLDDSLHMKGDHTNENLESLFMNSETRIYKKQEEIYKEGATPLYLYYVLSGKCRTCKTHEIGKKLSIDMYSAGDFFGYTALLENSVYKETATALDHNTEIARVPRKGFDDLLQSNPAVAQRLVKIMAKNIVKKEKHLLDIAYNTLRQKVAGTLVSLQKKYHLKNSEFYCVDLSRDELASIAGTAVESFIRMLGEFKNEKLIDIKKDNKIEIINFKKLENIAG